MSINEPTGPHKIESPVLAFELVLARHDLTAFIKRQAIETEQRLGFGLRACADAPITYQQLRGAYADSIDSREPLPISNLFCDATIYATPLDNLLFRFWHDASHMRLGVSFNLDDELELALWHLEQLERAGFASGSLPWNVLHADLVGQIQLMGLIGRFPINQRRFVTDCIEYGFEVGLLEEIRRIPEPEALAQTRSDILVAP